ncbi:MAG: HAD family hydrolase [Brevinema sp.]
MLKLSLYDFDRTIYNGDTGVRVLKFLFKNYSKQTYPYFWQILWTMTKYIFKINNKITFKQNIYRVITTFSPHDWEKIMIDFWEKEKNNFFPDVVKQLKKDREHGYTIGIISASPEIMLTKIQDLIPCDFLIGTIFAINYHTASIKIVGENCKHEEKVQRLYQYMKTYYPNETYVIKKMYSDSDHDMPLLTLAEEAFTVESNGIIRPGYPKKNRNF